MALVQIGAARYRCPEGWADIPLDRAIRLHEACAALPERIRAVYAPVFDEKAEPVALPEEDLAAFAAFQREVVEILCGIPANQLAGADTGEVAAVYRMLELFAVSMMYGTLGFEPSGAAYFDWQGERYYYPASGTDMAGNPVYMQGLSALQLAQVSDLAAVGGKMEAGEYAYAATMVAVVCLKEGEVYTEELARRRTPLFATLPMSVVLEVFFCLRQLTAISLMNTRIATAEAERKRSAIQRRRGLRSHGRNGCCWSPNGSRCRRGR